MDCKEICLNLKTIARQLDTIKEELRVMNTKWDCTNGNPHIRNLVKSIFKSEKQEDKRTIEMAKDVMLEASAKLTLLTTNTSKLEQSFHRAVNSYAKHVDKTSREWGGLGLVSVEPENENDLKVEDPLEMFTDDGFVETARMLRSFKTPYSRMRKITEIIGAVSTTAEDINRKHEKLVERKRLGGGSFAEIEATERMRKKILNAKKTLKNRVGMILKSYSEAQDKVMGSLVGSAEMLAENIKKARMFDVANESLNDISLRCKQLVENNNKAKGE